MRYAVRSLGWATKILWILIIAFSVSAVYSVMNVQINFGEPQVFLLDETITMSIPLFINNTGLYDLSEINVTASVMDHNESLLSTSSNFVPLIQRGSSVEMTQNISLGFGDITSEAEIYLFNDTIFNVDMSAKLIFAHTIPFQVSTNLTLPWGAPLSNFSLGQTSYNLLNLTHQELIIPISFENHSPYFDVDGLMQVEILNDNNELLRARALDLDVPSHSNYDGQVEIVVDVSETTGSGEVHLYFETSALSFGPMVIPYG